MMTTEESRIITSLEEARHLSHAEYAVLLSHSLSDDAAENLRSVARKITDNIFGREVRVRGLIEITNVCRNNCLYCGLRKGNTDIRRYSLSDETILATCREGHDVGFRTFVLQGGENPAFTRTRMDTLVAAIHSEFPDAAITLSLGEWDDDALRDFKEAGASRYLLRHETYDPLHYSRLHPTEMSRDNRIRCLRTLKRLGYQTGTGIMVGSPFQSLGNIADDLAFMHSLQPEMIGIGPFIPHKDTPFASFAHGSVEMTLRLISILRIMFPHANIPATTALASIDPDGRNKGLMAGANVVMPNLSPLSCRKEYAIYDNKAFSGAESAEGLAILADEIKRIGLEITTEKGDFSYV